MSIKHNIPGVPYYDNADQRLLAWLSIEKCQQYVAQGVAFAVTTKKGVVKRLYRIPRTKCYGTAAAAVAAMHGAAGRLTERLRNDAGVVISPPLIIKHRALPARATNPKWDKGTRE